MLDLFTIFSKGGFVLWCFQGTSQSFTTSVNALIKSVILQERGGLESFTHEALTLKYRLDNEFELVFVVAYQKFLQLSYVDKFLNDIQIEFRNKYKDDLSHGKISRDFSGFTSCYQKMLQAAEETSKLEARAPRPMRKFEDSEKSKKTVASMIERKDADDGKKAGKKKNKAEQPKKEQVVEKPAAVVVNSKTKTTPPGKSTPPKVSGSMANGKADGEMDDETIRANREKFFMKAKKSTAPKIIEDVKKTPEDPKKKGKASRQWDLSGKAQDSTVLDYSREKGSLDVTEQQVDTSGMTELVGKMAGALKDLEPDDDGSDDENEAEEVIGDVAAKGKMTNGSSGKGSSFGFLSGLRGLVGSKTLTRDDVQPVLEKMRDHLIAKNVASEIAEKLCDSIATKLEGRVLGTFHTVYATVRAALTESCIQILTPRRRIDILRDAMDARVRGSPYVAVFCGVNGVGKSTNLAKICFWLIENNFRVLIAACDTFRAGAVEQLRTHCRKLNALHPDQTGARPVVMLYDKGYGKDPAGIASEAISYARDQRFDIVLVDTAGRMQDNAPLMRSLAKLIKVNQPDLVLFVGEALVGNEAVDQLVKFNQALADHSASESNPHLIDGIVLTKFDTIDDKVGAAISMTYITGQPIVFVGTGQTYTDLKNLNAKSVVHALLK